MFFKKRKSATDILNDVMSKQLELCHKYKTSDTDVLSKIMNDDDKKIWNEQTARLNKLTKKIGKNL